MPVGLGRLEPFPEIDGLVQQEYIDPLYLTLVLGVVLLNICSLDTH